MIKSVDFGLGRHLKSGAVRLLSQNVTSRSVMCCFVAAEVVGSYLTFKALSEWRR